MDEVDRTEVLAQVATALAAATDVTEVSEALIEALCPALADGCEVVLRGQDGALWRVAAGPGELRARVGVAIPDAPDHPLRRAAGGELLVIDVDHDEQQTLFGPADLATSARALGVTSAVVAPLASGDTTVGALAVAMGSSGRRLHDDDRSLVQVVGQLAGRTIDNLRTADLQRRVAARLRTAAEIGARFAEAEQADEIAGILLRRAADELGAHSGLIYLLDGERLELAAYFGHGAERVEPWRSVPVDATTVAGAVMSGSVPSIWLETLDEVLQRYPRLGTVDGSSERSLAAVRLSHGDQPVGAAFWTFDVSRRFSDADRGFVELIADQAAAAIGRARVTSDAARTMQQLLEIEQRQRQIAQTLQASLLPRELPVIDGFEIHVEYWPAAADMDVGGDFYDIFAIDESRWALVIGDVCGKGAPAAAVTGTARHSLRAAATHIRDERRVIRWVHDAIVAHADAPFCTLAYAVVETGEVSRLRVVLAGHDRGLRIDSAGHVTDLGVHGTLLGVLPPSLGVHEVELAHGDLVVFYTDGVTDAPAGEALERSELAELLRTHRHAPLPDIGAGLRGVLDARRADGDRDDTALLMLRRRPATADA